MIRTLATRPAWAGQTAVGLVTAGVAAAACLARRRWERAGRRAGRGVVEAGGVAADGRLTAQPGRPTAPPIRGLQCLGLGWPCDGVLYVPAGYRPDHPAPFLLLLHGATGVGLAALWPVVFFADAADLIILAPDSRGWTWDRPRGAFGPDVAFIDRALAAVYRRYAVDPSRLAIGGFSDGASEALSLGLTNGDLFRAIIAFSPGFLAPGPPVGHPRVFVSHGTRDRILPVSGARRIVDLLRARGDSVSYRQFVGPHAVPLAIARAAVHWLLQPDLGAYRTSRS